MPGGTPRSQAGVPLDDAERAKIIALLRQRIPVETIAHRMHRGRSTVLLIRQRAGIPGPNDDRWRRPIEELAFSRPLLVDVDFLGTTWTVTRCPDPAALDPQRGRTWNLFLL